MAMDFYSDSLLLKFILLLNLVAMVLLASLPQRYSYAMKQVSLLLSLKMFVISLVAFSCKAMDSSLPSMGLHSIEILDFYGSEVAFCCDGISLSLVVLTTFLTFLCLAISLELPNFKLFSLCFFLMELLLLVVWTACDVFVFYVFFESVLIPMFLVIHLWGSRARKVRAAFLFFLYTVLGSMPMLLAILYVHGKVGTTNVWALQLTNVFSFSEQCWLWLAFFLAFAVKVPMLPFHLWLPEAHVEAPTAGSVMLAGVLLKLGSYAMLRFLNPLFVVAGLYFTPMVQTFAICGVVYASLTALRQNDLKRVIAYASISHMCLIVIGIFSLSIYALEGAVFQMISHGLVASLLFLMVGVLYDRSGTRLIANYSGLAMVMPTFATYFLMATLANLAFPGTSNFVGEVLLFLGIFQVNVMTGFLSALGIFLVSTYSIWLYNRVFFGNISPQVQSYRDLDSLDAFVIQILLLAVVGLGLYPHHLLSFVYGDCLYLTSVGVLA